MQVSVSTTGVGATSNPPRKTVMGCKQENRHGRPPTILPQAPTGLLCVDMLHASLSHSPPEEAYRTPILYMDKPRQGGRTCLGLRRTSRQLALLTVPVQHGPRH